MVGPVAERSPRLKGRLWHHRDFLKFWTGDTLSQFLTQVSGIAIPTIAIKLFDANAFQLGLLGTLSTISFPTLGLFVGVWADRFRRRPFMIVANVIRASTLASIPVAYFAGALGLAQLFVVTLLIGTCTVFFDVSYQSYLPSLIDKEDLVEGNSKLQTSASVAQPGGQALASLLFAVVGYAESVVADVIGYLGSAVALLAIKKEEPLPEPSLAGGGRNFYSEMKEGVHVVFRNPVLTRIALCTATANLGSSIATAVLLLFAYNYAGISPQLIGIVLAVSSFGVLLGAQQAPSLIKRFGIGRVIAVGAFGGITFIIAPLALTFNPYVIYALAFFLGGWFVVIYNISQVSLRQAIVPIRLQGRMNATMRTIVWGTLPVGSFIGGVLGTLIGLQATIIGGSLLSAFAVAFVVVGPVVKLKEIPKVETSA
jgi:MFS family permease